jgi:VCBS repeat-containing protein
MAANVWVNEIDYYHANGETGGKYVEIVGEAGTDLSGWKIYDAISTGVASTTTIGAVTLADNGNGFGVAKIDISVLQDGHRGTGLALEDPEGHLVQLIGYGTESITMPVGSGAASGMTTSPIGVSEYSDYGTSVQLTGTGNKVSDFTWTVASMSGGTLNAGQTLTSANTPPSLTGSLDETVGEGASVTLKSADLYYSDDNASDTPDQVTFTVSHLLHGQIQVDGVVAESFTARDIDDGKVAFMHDGSETSTAGFDVLVEDGNEDDSTPVASHFSLTVEAVNDPATITGVKTGTVQELVSTSVSGKLLVSDPDSDETFKPEHGQMTDGGHGEFSITAAGKWTYTLLANDENVTKLDSGDSIKDHFSVQSADGTTAQIAIAIKGITNINGSNGNDQGASGTLHGTSGDDDVHALKGNDIAFGLKGNDYLFGDAGNDTLYGDGKGSSSKDGDDWLEGGAGKDMLWGGGGADTFAFADGDSGVAAKARDNIGDFSHDDGDRIDLGAIDANGSTAKEDAFKIYTDEKQALAHSGALFIDKHGADSTVYLNTDAAKGFEMAIDVGTNKLASGDFVL